MTVIIAITFQIYFRTKLGFQTTIHDILMDGAAIADILT